MKSVLFMVSTLRKSGPTHQLLHLCRHLPQYGFETHILTLSPEQPHDTMRDQFDRIGATYSSLGLSRLEGIILIKRRAREFVERVAPDVIHSQGLRSDQVAARIHGKIPHVLTVRNSAWEDYPPMFGRTRGSLMAWQHSRLIARAQAPIACSRSLAKQLERFRANMEAIPNGVDTDSYVPVGESEQLNLRRRLALPDTRPLLLHVGSLIERKRPMELLRSFISSGLTDAADLIFVGDGPLRASLQEMARSHRNVHFTGAVKNVIDYLRCGSLLVSLSASEGLPNSVLEALSCGLPVVLSAIEPHREIGAHTRGAGVLVQDMTPEALSAAVNQVLSSDSTRQKECARKLVVESFSASNMAARYAQAYSALLGLSHSNARLSSDTPIA